MASFTKPISEAIVLMRATYYHSSGPWLVHERRACPPVRADGGRYTRNRARREADAELRALDVSAGLASMPR